MQNIAICHPTISIRHKVDILDIIIDLRPGKEPDMGDKDLRAGGAGRYVGGLMR